MKRTSIVILIIIMATIAIVLSLVIKTNPYSDFKTLENNEGEEYQIIGKLSEKYQIDYDVLQNPNFFSFGMIDDKGETRKVYYFDAKPQDFEKSDQIVIVASYRNDSIIASSLLLKCPSKYNDQQKPELFENKTFN